jgi:hypothetical protein
MLHKCNIHCYSIDEDIADYTGVEDSGKWLPFMFSLDIITAIKCTTDEEEDLSYNCSTIFPTVGDIFTIDTPYTIMMSIWNEYYSKKYGTPSVEESSSSTEL